MPLRDIVLEGNFGPAGDCWIWEHARFAAGYGSVLFGGKNVYVHRLSYETHVGPIPAGLTIDHLCRERACWNPAHLEAVTNAENIRRAALHKTHCPRGHDYAKYARRRKRGRDCLICHRDRERERSRRNREGAR